MAFANRWNHSRYDSVGRLKRPAVWESVHNAASWWPDEESQEARQFVEFMKTIDLVVATGSGGINDEFAYHAVMVLLMLHLARSMEIPVAMFGQGLGPVTNPHLRSVMQQVLPQVNFLGLREGRHGLPLAESLGVPREKIEVTGDGGLEIAHLSKPETIGSAVGVNVRMTDYSGVNARGDRRIGRCDFGGGDSGWMRRAYRCRFALPTDGASDLEVTAPILKRCPEVIDVPPTVARLQELMPYVAQCRCVVTGSYHAGVFALAMGIPVVGIGGQLVLHAKVSRSGGPVSGRVPND